MLHRFLIQDDEFLPNVESRVAPFDLLLYARIKCQLRAGSWRYLVLRSGLCTKGPDETARTHFTGPAEQCFRDLPDCFLDLLFS